MTEQDTKLVASGERQAPRSAQAPRPATQGSNAAGGDNIVDLVRQLAGQGSHLAEQQLSLVKAEIREATAEVKTAVGSMVGAAVVGISGLGVTLMGAAYLLGQAIGNTALATLIVGIATLVLAYVLYRAGAKKMSTAHLGPERSQRTLERTPEIARGDLHTEPTR